MTDTNKMRELVTGAVARAWCHPANSHKEMDSDLALAAADEVVAALAGQSVGDAEPTLWLLGLQGEPIKAHARWEKRPPQEQIDMLARFAQVPVSDVLVTPLYAGAPPRAAEPLLTANAKVGNAIFNTGCRERLVIDAAQRQWAYSQTDEGKAERAAELERTAPALAELQGRAAEPVSPTSAGGKYIPTSTDDLIDEVRHQVRLIRNIRSTIAYSKHIRHMDVLLDRLTAALAKPAGEAQPVALTNAQIDALAHPIADMKDSNIGLMWRFTVDGLYRFARNVAATSQQPPVSDVAWLAEAHGLAGCILHGFDDPQFVQEKAKALHAQLERALVSAGIRSAQPTPEPAEATTHVFCCLQNAGGDPGHSLDCASRSTPGAPVGGDVWKLIEAYARDFHAVDYWSGKCTSSVILDRAYVSREALVAALAAAPPQAGGSQHDADSIELRETMAELDQHLPFDWAFDHAPELIGRADFRAAVKRARAALAATPQPVGGDVAGAVCRAVAELPDRNSPEGWPEAMLVTHDELRAIVAEALAATPPQAERPFPEPEGGIYCANETVAKAWSVPVMTMFKRVGYPSELADVFERCQKALAAATEKAEPDARDAAIAASAPEGGV